MLINRAYMGLTRQMPLTFGKHGDLVFFYIRVSGLMLLSLYIFYLAIVTVGVLRIIKQMKKAYKYVILTTLCVALGSLIVLLCGAEND